METNLLAPLLFLLNWLNKLASIMDVETKIGLTGFKWIAKMIQRFQELWTLLEVVKKVLGIWLAIL